MAKKNRDNPDIPAKKARQGKEPFTCLSITFENTDAATAKQHLMYLALIAVVARFLVFLVSSSISFVDYFDYAYYLEHAALITQGQLPYAAYNFDYPVLAFVPIFLALIPTLIFQSAGTFFFSFQVLMVICDLVTLLCVYLIALKLYNERTAFLAALLYATAFATAYFVITKYDAFPTCLLMLAVLFAVCGMKMRGYLAAGLGFFAKIFPALAFPFLILHNTKESSLKDEIVSVLRVMVPLCIVLLIPVLLVRPEAIRTYLFATGGSVGVYVNTLTYTVYSWISGVAHIGITPENVSLLMYLLMGITLLYLLYAAWTDEKKRPVTLLTTLLLALVAVIVFTKFHSPQYIVWFTPFLCLLVTDDARKIALFYLVQLLAYIEFPLMFGGYYTNLEYSHAAGSTGWYVTLLFFTLQYAVLIFLVLWIARPCDLFRAFRKSGKKDPE